MRDVKFDWLVMKDEKRLTVMRSKEMKEQHDAERKDVVRMTAVICQPEPPERQLQPQSQNQVKPG